MRCSKRAKLILLAVTSLCFLSLWTSLWEGTPTSLMSVETFSINQKSLVFPEALVNTKVTFNTNSTINNGAKENNISSINKTNNSNSTSVNQTPTATVESTPSVVKQSRTILVSYMRSGSTFTGDLFQSSPEVMYLYEPLLYTNDVDELARNTPIKARVIHKFYADPKPPETLDYTMATLRCNLSAWNLKYLIGYTYSRSFDDYAACLKNMNGRTVANLDSKCSTDVTKRCQQSRSVISKILRLKMWEVDEVLTLDPDLKIIHLVRDPRGITVSRKVARYYLSIKTLCVRMSKDAHLSIQLQKKYPGRILTARYEDLALSPLNVTRKLYEHAGVKWTKQIADKVQDLTSPLNNSFKEDKFGTKRKNSAATAFNWRTQLDFPTASNIQSSCKDVMQLYGYVSFNTSQQMNNLNIPTIRDNYSNGFFKAQNFPTFES